MINIKQKGDFSKTLRYLDYSKKAIKNMNLEAYAEEGLQALRAATPVDSGETADSWTYDIIKTDEGVTIQFNNTNINDRVNIAIILQYGHGTGTGGYVEGRDYINPALRPIFDRLAEEAWKEVERSK